MSDEAKNNSGKTWLYVWGGIASLPVCYVLFAGPFVVLMWRRVLPPSLVRSIYGPFDQALRDTLVYPAWDGYLRAWMDFTGTTFGPI